MLVSCELWVLAEFVEFELCATPVTGIDEIVVDKILCVLEIRAAKVSVEDRCNETLLFVEVSDCTVTKVSVDWVETMDSRIEKFVTILLKWFKI